MGLMTTRNMALNFHDNSGVAICPVRPYSQAVAFYWVALEPGELKKLLDFNPKG